MSKESERLLRKRDIISDIDLIIGRNNEITDDTHMDLVDEVADYVEKKIESYHREQMIKKTGDFVQFIAVELRGEELSPEDIESIIHDYIHPREKTNND